MFRIFFFENTFIIHKFNKKIVKLPFTDFIYFRDTLRNKNKRFAQKVKISESIEIKKWQLINLNTILYKITQ